MTFCYSCLSVVLSRQGLASINYSKLIMSVKLGRILKKKNSSILLDILTDKVCGLDKQGTMFLNCKINPRSWVMALGWGAIGLTLKIE